ncbi:MAG: MmcQ/YjbR family DNA-binding protein [Planctomycetes bacterium]|nr:MmcQ/YjbR family DNA-binding protein [Planctomycetota bacterium]
MKAADFRRLALALPDVVEADHHGFPSFRVASKIFATLRDSEHAHVFVDADEIERALDVAGDACAELWWGKKLCGLRIELARADRRLVGHWLAAAWRARAPKKSLAKLERPAS